MLDGVKSKVALAALAAAVVVPGAAVAQDYPSKPITIVISGQVGGSIDSMARQFLPFWQEAIGQRMTIVNKSGGQGITGVRYFMEQPTDGYTIMVGTEAHFTAAVEKDPNLKQTDIELINMQEFDPAALTVMKDSGFDSLEKLVKTIKDKPDSITWGSVPTGAPGLVGMELAKSWGLNARFVPQDGGSASDTALLGGHVNYKFGTAAGDSTELPGAQVLAVAAPDRLAYLPDVPTFNEIAKTLGLPENIPNLGSARMIFVTAKMKQDHPDRFQKLVDSYKATLENPDYRKLLKSAGSDQYTMLLDPAEATKRFRELSANSLKYRK